MTALHLRGVRRVAPKGGAVILERIDLRAGRGEWLNLAGPSGSGKSSLLRLLNRLDEADGGEIEVLGRPLADWPVRQLRRRAALVFQEPVLIGNTVREALTLPLQIWQEQAPVEEGVLAESLQGVGLSGDFLDRRCDSLSVGQRQLAAIARALLTGPALLLLDEPTAGLDEQSAQQLLQHLLRLHRERGMTVLIANHRLAEVRGLGGRLVVLLEGSVAADGAMAQVFADPPGSAVREFLQGYGDFAGGAAPPPAPAGEGA